jgi:hypothetical protein
LHRRHAAADIAALAINQDFATALFEANYLLAITKVAVTANRGQKGM